MSQFHKLPHEKSNTDKLTKYGKNQSMVPLQNLVQGNFIVSCIFVP